MHRLGLRPPAEAEAQYHQQTPSPPGSGTQITRSASNPGRFTTLVRAANTARKQDPQLARIYHQQMTERGKDHLGALCVVAATLAERAWTVMRRGTPYVICDTDGRPVTPQQASTIIASRWTVPPEVRARWRSKRRERPPRKSSKDNANGAASPAAPLHLVTGGQSR